MRYISTISFMLILFIWHVFYSKHCEYIAGDSTVSSANMTTYTTMLYRLLSMNDKYADGSGGAMVRIMVRGGCLSVGESTRMAWRLLMNDVCGCVCGDVESE